MTQSALQAIADAVHGRVLDSSIACPAGEISVHLTEGEHYVTVGDISVWPRGRGLGSAAMEALHAYVTAAEKTLTVQYVANRAFFDRFCWLEAMADDDELADVDYQPHYTLRDPC